MQKSQYLVSEEEERDTEEEEEHHHHQNRIPKGMQAMALTPKVQKKSKLK